MIPRGVFRQLKKSRNVSFLLLVRPMFFGRSGFTTSMQPTRSAPTPTKDFKPINAATNGRILRYSVNRLLKIGQTKVFRESVNSLYQDFSKQTQFLTEKMSGLLGFDPISGILTAGIGAALPHFFGGWNFGGITRAVDVLCSMRMPVYFTAYDRDLISFCSPLFVGVWKAIITK